MLFDLKELENILNNMRDALRLLSFHNKRCSVSDDSMTTERSLIRFSISFLEGAFTMTESKFLTINYLQKNSFTCVFLHFHSICVFKNVSLERQSSATVIDQNTLSWQFLKK